MSAIGFGLWPGAGRRAQTGFGFGGPALPPGAALTRASAASFVTADGALAFAAPDGARFDHDADGRLRGLMIERALTNGITAPGPITAANWPGDTFGSGQLPTFIDSSVTAPDGTPTASRIAFVRGSDFARIARAEAVVPGTRYCLSVWLRAAAEGPAISLRLDGANGETLIVGPRWRRYALSAVAESAAMSCQLLLWSAIAGAPEAATVDIWGAQFEPGSAPSSFAANTRAADVVTLDWRMHGVADGPMTLRYQFDDGAAEHRPTMIADGRSTVPVDLARPWVRRIERL